MMIFGFAGVGFMAYRRKAKPALMAAWSTINGFEFKSRLRAAFCLAALPNASSVADKRDPIHRTLLLVPEPLHLIRLAVALSAQHTKMALSNFTFLSFRLAALVSAM
jgi:hypothetical protein